MRPTVFCLFTFAKPTEVGVWLASLCLMSCSPLLPLRVSSHLPRLWLFCLSFSVQLGVLHCKPSYPILIFHLRRASKVQKGSLPSENHARYPKRESQQRISSTASKKQGHNTKTQEQTNPKYICCYGEANTDIEKIEVETHGTGPN